MGHPAGIVDLRVRGGSADGDAQGRFAVQRRVDAFRIVIDLEVGELSFEVTAVPKQNMIEKLAPSSANQPLHKGMREWNVRYCFDLIDIQYPQICLPTMKFEQGVMIGTDVSRCALTADGLVEHPAKRYPIHSANMNTKTDDLSGELTP